MIRQGLAYRKDTQAGVLCGLQWIIVANLGEGYHWYKIYSRPFGRTICCNTAGAMISAAIPDG